MMWHFYEIPYIPDLELVKYQSLGEQGIDGILERHNRFLRQWQRNTVLILRSQYRRDCQAINELFISAERKAMLDELIRSIGESLQQKIKNNVVFLDSNGQLE